MASYSERWRNEVAIPETDYADLLNTAVPQIHASRNAIAIQVNTAAMTTYWNLGKLLYDRKIEGGYGSNVIQRLSVDLKASFPDMGLSPRNLWNMKLFYERYRASDEKLLRAVAVLQWGHNLLLINKKISDEETYYYATEAFNNWWNRDYLINAIKMNMYEAHKDEQRDNNFLKALPHAPSAHRHAPIIYINSTSILIHPDRRRQFRSMLRIRIWSDSV